MQVRAHLRALRRFRGARHGNVAILFALFTPVLLGFGGAAIDYGLATRLHVKLQASTDATALNLCQTPRTTTTQQLQQMADALMTSFMAPAKVTLDPLGVTSNPRQVTLTTHSSQAPFFGGFTGSSALLEVGASARCATPQPKTFEIALVLDNTGSMNSSGGGQTKMEALKAASLKFIDYVRDNDAFASDTRLSIVPFAAAVAVPTRYRSASWIDQNGKSFFHWPNIWSPETVGFTNRFQIFDRLARIHPSWDWAGCLETLPYPLNVRDGAPSSSNAESYFVPMFAPDEPGPGNDRHWCYNSNDTNCVINTYLDDETDQSNCRNANKLNFDERHARVCKYVSPRGAVRTTSNRATGLPNGPNFSCTSQPLTTLTSDVTAQKAAINGMIALGATNTYEGLIWGWRTLSPLSVFAGDPKPPVAYTSKAVGKILILMTDGANTWPMLDPTTSRNKSLYFSPAYISNANGVSVNRRLPPANRDITDAAGGRSALDALTDESCTNAKAAGISIYSIGFSTPSDPIDQKGLALLSKCATNADQFFVANNADGLITAFDQIAKSIGKLRLSK